MDSTEVVLPQQVNVLNTNTGDRPALVLVTCYPFAYIGSAPMRFIVRAHLESVTPES